MEGKAPCPAEREARDDGVLAKLRLVVSVTPHRVLAVPVEVAQSAVEGDGGLGVEAVLERLERGGPG